MTITAKVGRSSAVGLYVTSFYAGGSFGAALGGVAWTYGGWPACVALVVAMLAVMAGIVYFGWARRVPPAPRRRRSSRREAHVNSAPRPGRFAQDQQRSVEQHEAGKAGDPGERRLVRCSASEPVNAATMRMSAAASTSA